MRVAVVTGGRSDRGYLDVLVPALKAHAEVVLISCGSSTDGDIVTDTLLANDSPQAIAKSTGMTLIELAHAYSECKPDVVLVLGDRYEIIAAALAAHLMHIPIAHLHGGETTEGSLDDRMRNAVSMLSELHFTAHPTYTERLLEMGVPGVVHNVGSLSVERAIPCRRSKQAYPWARIMVSVPESHDGEAQAIAQALEEFDSPYVTWLGPNTDAGRESLVRYANTADLSPEDFMALLSIQDVLVGNTSAGIYEASVLGVPFVNVGDRQRGRITHESVIHVPVDAQAIADGIKKALALDFEAGSPFGNGDTSRLITEALCGL